MVSELFVEGRRQIVASEVEIRKKDQKNLRSKLVDNFPKQDVHKQRTFKYITKNTQITNHDL